MNRGALAVFVVVLFAGCGGGGESAPLGEPVETSETVAAEEFARASCTPGEEEPVGRRAESYAASARARTTAYSKPAGKRLRSFGRLNVNRVPTIFGVLGIVRGADCLPDWYRVQLPIRPNGATGYVRAKDVSLYRVDTFIEVDISERRVEFFRAGRRVLRVPSAVGSSATPTPTGRYYVNQRLRSGDPSGPFGPGGIGISAFSPVLTGWVQGGPIAIHGTNEPDSIGQPVSNGCLRVANDVLVRLFEATLNGTPVVIRA